RTAAPVTKGRRFASNAQGLWPTPFRLSVGVHLAFGFRQQHPALGCEPMLSKASARADTTCSRRLKVQSGGDRAGLDGLRLPGRQLSVSRYTTPLPLPPPAEATP